MKVDIYVKYSESYLPTPRCRKLRYRTVDETLSAELIEAEPDMKLAFEDCYYEKKSIAIFADSQGNLWRKATERDIWACDTGKTALEALIECGITSSSYYYFDNNTTRNDVIDNISRDLEKYRVLGDVLYIRETEPMYEIATFGLGHNHGGTGLMTSHYYNPNISYKRYYNANEGDKAVAEANRIAEARGDTNDLGRFRPHIKVYMPELVKRNPASEHGDSDPFLNTLDAITESANSISEAALLTMAVTAKEISS